MASVAKASGLATSSLSRVLLIETNKQKIDKPLMVPESLASDKRDGQHGTEKKVVKDANLNLGPH